MLGRLLRIARRVALDANAAIRLKAAIVVRRNKFHRAWTLPRHASKQDRALGGVGVDAIRRAEYIVHTAGNRNRRQRLQCIQHLRPVSRIRHDLRVHLKIAGISLPIIRSHGVTWRVHRLIEHLR